jgi:hypothetical protein
MDNLQDVADEAVKIVHRSRVVRFERRRLRLADDGVQPPWQSRPVARFSLWFRHAKPTGILHAVSNADKKMLPGGPRLSQAIV